jgi:hypothetical protein
VAVVNNGPRKGGKAAVYHRLRGGLGGPESPPGSISERGFIPRERTTPGVQDVFQVHRNVDTTQADNAPPELVANDEAACAGEWIRLRVAPDAKSYTVEVHGKGTKRTYAVK